MSAPAGHAGCANAKETLRTSPGRARPHPCHRHLVATQPPPRAARWSCALSRASPGESDKCTRWDHGRGPLLGDEEEKKPNLTTADAALVFKVLPQSPPAGSEGFNPAPWGLEDPSGSRCPGERFLTPCSREAPLPTHLPVAQEQHCTILGVGNCSGARPRHKHSTGHEHEPKGAAARGLGRSDCSYPSATTKQHSENDRASLLLGLDGSCVGLGPGSHPRCPHTSVTRAGQRQKRRWERAQGGTETRRRPLDVSPTDSWGRRNGS